VCATTLLEPLHADVQAEVATLAEPADRDRMIQDRSTHAAVVAAYRRMHGQSAAAG
jgi:hypothetical protein